MNGPHKQQTSLNFKQRTSVFFQENPSKYTGYFVQASMSFKKNLKTSIWCCFSRWVWCISPTNVASCCRCCGLYSSASSCWRYSPHWDSPSVPTLRLPRDNAKLYMWVDQCGDLVYRCRADFRYGPANEMPSHNARIPIIKMSWDHLIFIMATPIPVRQYLFIKRWFSDTVKPLIWVAPWWSNKIVENSHVVGASPVGAAPTTSSFSTLNLASMDWAKTTARWDKKHYSFGIWCDLY